MNSAADPVSSSPVVKETPSFFRAFDFLAAPDCCAAGIWIELPPPCTGRAEALLIAAFALVLARQTSRHELQMSIAMQQGAPLAEVAPVRLDLQPLQSAGDLLAALSRILARSATLGTPDHDEPHAAIRLDCFECVANVGYSVKIASNANGHNRAHCSVLALKDANFGGFCEIVAGRLPHAMQWLVAHARSPLSDCDTVPPSERRRIAQFSSAVSVRYVSRDMTLHGLFEAQAGRTPDAIAVIFGDVRRSYRQLDDVSSRLAVCLRSRFAVQPGKRVAVVAQRSHLLIAALLGIMKAGCCYAPIDPRQPIERVTRMLDDVDPAVLIVDAENAAAAARYDRDIFVLDIELEQLDPVPEFFRFAGRAPKPGLHNLHLGIDGPPERRGRRALRGRQHHTLAQ